MIKFFNGSDLRTAAVLSLNANVLTSMLEANKDSKNSKFEFIYKSWKQNAISLISLANNFVNSPIHEKQKSYNKMSEFIQLFFANFYSCYLAKNTNYIAVIEYLASKYSVNYCHSFEYKYNNELNREQNREQQIDKSYAFAFSVLKNAYSTPAEIPTRYIKTNIHTIVTKDKNLDGSFKLATIHTNILVNQNESLLNESKKELSKISEKIEKLKASVQNRENKKQKQTESLAIEAIKQSNYSVTTNKQYNKDLQSILVCSVITEYKKHTELLSE